MGILEPVPWAVVPRIMKNTRSAIPGTATATLHIHDGVKFMAPPVTPDSTSKGKPRKLIAESKYAFFLCRHGICLNPETLTHMIPKLYIYLVTAVCKHYCVWPD